MYAIVKPTLYQLPKNFRNNIEKIKQLVDRMEMKAPPSNYSLKLIVKIGHLLVYQCVELGSLGNQTLPILIMMRN